MFLLTNQRIRMIQYTNVLSQQLLADINEERERKKKDEFCWRVGQFFWQDSLLYGVTNSCVSALLSDSLRTRLENELRDKLPPFNEIIAQHYVWLRGSGIAKHDDGAHNFGATIYLNKNWDINYGGVFLWKPENSAEYKTIVPEYNTMVVNTKAEEHLVTPIALNAPEYRHTVQIWRWK